MTKMNESGEGDRKETRTEEEINGIYDKWNEIEKEKRKKSNEN